MVTEKELGKSKRLYYVTKNPTRIVKYKIIKHRSGYGCEIREMCINKLIRREGEVDLMYNDNYKNCFCKLKEAKKEFKNRLLIETITDI